MRENRGFKILKKLLSKEKILKYERELIYQDNNGTYHLYGVYTITKINGYYTVNKQGTYEEKKFSELKNAVTWVTLEKRQKYTESTKVYNLDLLLDGAKESLKTHQELCSRTKDTEQRSIYVIKLIEDKFKKKMISEELETYINNCKRWQLKQFETSTEK